jgi:isopentenyldiphosphate isomerase
VAEIFDVVNEADTVVGQAAREQVHGNPSLIHRVAHVLVFRSDGALFLQLRSPDKDVQPGKWDTSVGGHVDAGESYDEAARREMAEELGIEGARLEAIYRYLHRNAFESEMVTTFRTVWDGSIHTDPVEITAGRFWTLDEIEADDPSVFTPNFLDELSRYRAWVRGRTG